MKLEDHYLILTAICVLLTLVLAFSGCGADLERDREARRHNACEAELTACVLDAAEICADRPGCMPYFEAGCLEQRDVCNGVEEEQ